MTTEQARQEAERRTQEFSQYTDLYNNKEQIDHNLWNERTVQCALISINREMAICLENNLLDKLQDLNQIKDELLKM
jgi:hypothetical protein